MYIQLAMNNIWASAYPNLLKFEAYVIAQFRLFFTSSLPLNEVSSACQALSYMFLSALIPKYKPYLAILLQQDKESGPCGSVQM